MACYTPDDKDVIPTSRQEQTSSGTQHDFSQGAHSRLINRQENCLQHTQSDL